jgi:hypothetical protein
MISLFNSVLDRIFKLTKMATQVTTVVTSQPGAAPRDWASGVFGCFEDIKSCKS